jgi:transcriptional regulator with XRE-family HTH domain
MVTSMSNFLSIAEQLNVLLSMRTHPNGRAYTLQEVSDGTGIGAATISQMRTGRIKNPQFSTIRALCVFFNVPLRFFETRTVEECYALLQAQDEPTSNGKGEISEIAFRATRLSSEAQQDILTIIKWVQAAEKAQKEGNDALPPLPRLTRSDDTHDANS